jgi:phage terminase large subunit
MTAVRAVMLAQEGKTGVIVCGREYMNSLEESSFAEVKASIESEPWLLDRFEIGEKYIRTKDRRINYVFCGLRHNLGSIKSKARIHIMWVDEAEPVSEEAWKIIIPTVREEDSELWITWNPERKKSATNIRFREKPPKNSKIVELNWRDNPKFPKVLEEERNADLEDRPDDYDHIWEGDYVTARSGAYFAKSLSVARYEGRIGRVAADPLMSLRAFWDIGGTGQRADACSIWIEQFIGKEIRSLAYYEAVGQDLATHIAWLRDNGYEKAHQVLPHDGAQHEKIERITYESALQKAGFSVEVIQNQGAGAARARIEALRRVFPYIWFNEPKTEPGIDALGWYHEKWDDKRDVGLGPDHDWSSHCADAKGLMAIYYENYYTASARKIQQIKRHGSAMAR